MSGLLSVVGGDGAAGALVRLPRRRRTPSWAVADPVVELAERLAEACASAVHPDEIAALLESEGLTDEQITERYEHRDLFALAGTLFALVPRAYPEPAPAADPWRTDLGRCVLRGLTFALPGVAYVIGGRWAGGPDGPFGVSGAVAGWAAAALFSWGWNQGLAHRAGLLLLAGRRRAAARCLLSGGAAGTVPATAAAVGVTGLAHPSAPAFAAGQALYMAAATTLLVLGRERTLLYVLAPLTLAAACGAAALPSPAAAALLAATVAAATAAAVASALRRADGELPPAAGQNAPVRRGPAALLRRGSRILPAGADGTPAARRGPAALLRRAAGRMSRAAGREARRRDAAAGRGQGQPAAGQVAVGRSVPVAVAGFAAGGLVVAAALAGEFVASLTVSMGVAEWLLFRLRSRCLVALRRTGVAERLLARSWRVLARCLGGYAAALVALAGVESAVLPGAAAWDAPHLGVLLALGCTLWLALLLQSCERSWTAAAVLSAATATALPLLAARTGTPGTVIGLTGSCAAAVLLAAATAATARVTTHR
ncbi:hypothetical protein NMG29_12845 [Streptomyces cocklensis]|nr:hypothetical protein [Actinacidiphila cocklensis]